MKAFGIFVVGALALLASLAVACGDSNDAPATEDAGGAVVSGGMIARDQFMTYDGHRYELVNMIFESMVPAEEFRIVGVVTQSDVDLRDDNHVYSRSGDTAALYTHSAATTDDNGYWLAWRLAS